MLNDIFWGRVPKSEPKYKAGNSSMGDARGYNNINSKSKRQQRTRMRKTMNDGFLKSFVQKSTCLTKKSPFQSGFLTFVRKFCRKFPRNSA